MFDAEFNIGDLDGSNGFTITGNNAFDNLGTSVSNAGDVNGDGIDDVIIGASGVEVNGVDNAGQSYVLFGTETIVAGGSFNISDIEDATGLIINGVQGGAGASVSAAGDINNDGIDDLIIGAPSFDDDDTTSRRPGASYVVFGNTNLDEDGLIELDLSSLNGENGFVINERLGTLSGSSVSGVGDVNGDTFDDLVISNFGAPSYLVFGGETLENNINNGSLNLSDLDNESGLVFLRTAISSGAGDVNNDGINDVIFGSLASNESYILFGDENLGGRLISSDLNGENGFVISGADRLDDFGASVSNLGDVNGDSIDDVIVSAPRANDVGASYVIFGSSNIGTDGPSTVSELDGNNGFVIEGLATNGSLGSSVSGAGDINGDGINDLIIGDRLFGSSDQSSSIANDYVVFGSVGLGSNGSLDLSALDGNNGFAITSTRFAGLGTSVSGAGDFNNDGVDDLIISDPRVFNLSGQSYIIFGSALAVPDTNSIEEDASDNQVTGNVLDNDNDVDGNGLTVAAVNDSPADVGQTIQGQYGSLVLNGNGTYTYTLDNANPTVDALNTGETLTDTFDYRVSDGSTEATTTLAITINGVTDGSSATFTVTEGLDDGTGNTTGTLSWAIQQANTQAGADVIELASDVRLNFADERIRMDPLIDSDLTIEGNGFTISGDNNNNGQVDIGNTDTNGDGFTDERDADRPVFFVESGNVTIRDLMITGAVARGEDGSGGGAGMGGGLFVSDGNITLDNVTFDNNRAVGGDAAEGSFGGGLGLGSDRNGIDGIDGFISFGKFSGGGVITNGRPGGDGSFGGGGGPGGSGGGKALGRGDAGGPGGDGGFGSGGGRGGFGGDGDGGVDNIGGNGGDGGFGGGSGTAGLGGFSKGGGGRNRSGVNGNSGFGGGSAENGSFAYGGGGAGLGGAIFIRSGTLSISNSSFNNNIAQGGRGRNFDSNIDDGSGFGGAIFSITEEALQNHNGSDQGLPTVLPTVNISNTQFSNNTADGVEDNIFGSPAVEANSISAQAVTQSPPETALLTIEDTQNSTQVVANADTPTSDSSVLPDNGINFKEVSLDAIVGFPLMEEQQTLIKTAFDVPETVDLTSFDPLEAAVAEDPTGVDVLAKLVTAQTTVVQTGALLQGALPQEPRSALETASFIALLDVIQNQVDAEQTVNLADSTQVQNILETTVTTLQSIDATLDLQPVSDAIPQLTQVISASNQAAFDAATNSSIPEAVNGLFQVQAVAQETVAADLQAAVAGEQSLDDVVTNTTGDALAEQIAAANANVAPVAIEDNFTTTTGTTLNGNVLADNGSGADTDFDGDMLSISAVNGEAPAVGQSLTLDSGASLTVNQDGTFTYIPANNFAGPDTFTYEVSDGNGGSDSAIATIIVQQTDIPAIIDLAPLFLIRNEGDSGTTTYSYTVTRRNVLDTTTLVNFELRNVVGLDTVDAADFVDNVLPSGTLTFNPGETIQTINIDVVGDTDIEPDELFRVRLSAPDGTTLQFGDGVIDVDDGTFEGVIQDDDDPQRPPRIAVDDSLRTDEDTPLNLPVQSLLANDTDGDTLSLISVDGTNTLGTVTLDGTTVVYDPNGQFESVQDLNSRTDRFTYTVSDSNGNTSTATVTVVVTGVNDPPMANPDTNSITEDAEPNTVSGDVLLNDADGDNPGAARQRLTVTAVNDDATAVGETITGQYGSLTLAADGDYTYTLDNSNPTVNALNNSETLIDSFSYRMSDGDLDDMTTLDITINGVTDGNGNQPPDAVNDDFSTDEDVPLSENVVTNDIDPDSEVLLVSLLTDVSNGSLMLNETGSFTYTPNADFNGTDSFTYEVNDGEFTDTAIATVTVNPINDNPVAVDDSATTSENTPVTITVLNNDSDVDGDPLTITSVVATGNGSAAINDDGTITYTPNPNFVGSDTFIYEVSDGMGGTAEASVNITVDPVGAVSDLDIGLYDADSDTLITPLNGGEQIQASSLDTDNLAIVALIPENSSLFGQVESIFLDLNDGQQTKRENTEPYALFGNSGRDFRGGSIPIGNNSISFDLYSEDNLRGELLETVTRDFTIIDDRATAADLDIGLYDADSDTLITILEEGDELLASTIAGQDVTIAAFIPEESDFFGKVESMFLDLNEGQITKRENIEPYALFGDNAGDFRGGSLPVGDNNLSFDLYSKDRLQGDFLGSITRSFTIINDLPA